MSRTPDDLQRMMREDTDIGLNYAHYKPMEAFIKERKYRTGIEIGTAYGGLANHLLSTCELDLLITIDPYKYYPDMPGLFDQEDYDNLRMQTVERLEKFNNCFMLREDSKAGYEWASRYIIAHAGEEYKLYKADFIFIDGWHERHTISWECNHYKNLVREGGALMGHDYDIFEDVNKAVNEFAKQEGKELTILPGNIWYLNY